MMQDSESSDEDDVFNLERAPRRLKGREFDQEQEVIKIRIDLF